MRSILAGYSLIQNLLSHKMFKNFLNFKVNLSIMIFFDNLKVTKPGIKLYLKPYNHYNYYLLTENVNGICFPDTK